MPPPAVLGIPGIVKVAVGLCRDLAEDDAEVLGLCKSAQQLGDCDEACGAAAQALARALHERVKESLSRGTQIPKWQTARADTVAREAHSVLSPAGAASEALALGLLADAQLSGGEATRAIRNAQQAAQLFRRAGDAAGEARALSTMLGAHFARATAGVDSRLEVSLKKDAVLEAMRQQTDQELERALEVGQEIIDIYQSTGDLEAEARTLSRVSEVHLAKGETDEAKMVAREARSIYEDLEDIEGQAAAARAVVSASMVSPDDADQALMAAKDMVQFLRTKQFGSQDLKRLLGEALVLLTRAQFQANQPEEALLSIKEAESVLGGAGSKAASTLAGALQVRAQIHEHAGDDKDAARVARQAAEVARGAKDRAGEAAALQLASNLELASIFKEVEADPKSFGKAHNERLEEAWKPMHEALKIYQELRSSRAEAEVGQQVQSFLARAKKINEKVATPVKTTVYIDPVTRKVREEHVYLADVEPQAIAAG